MQIKAEEKDGEIVSIIINDKYIIHHNTTDCVMELSKNDVPGSKLEFCRENSHEIIFW